MSRAEPGGFDLERYLEAARRRVDADLNEALPQADDPPPLLHRAMRYAVFAGGKRLRPILVHAGAEAAGGNAPFASAFACAIECIHTYSLVHDDLPALDDDDLRRGQPTVHKAFDEATAVLVGDSLLTFAFEMLVSSAGGEDRAGDGALRLSAMRALIAAIGTRGMIGGQVDDLLATGRPVDEDHVRSIHARKTGALLKACPVIGGMLAGAGPPLLAELARYGEDLGLAFQIVDDVLDIEGTSQTLGKSAGKDRAAGKATFPAVIGVARSRALAQEMAARAEDTAGRIGERARPLAALARFVVSRTR